MSQSWPGSAVDSVVSPAGREWAHEGAQVRAAGTGTGPPPMPALQDLSLGLKKVAVQGRRAAAHKVSFAVLRGAAGNPGEFERAGGRAAALVVRSLV